MKKVLVIGCPGSGKSVFSRKLADITSLPLIHLDSIYHQDIWDSDPARKKEQWEKEVRELVQGERWIIDGNYKGTLDIRILEADTVIFLDYSRSLTLSRALKRRFEFRNKRRPDMPETWKERIDWKFFSFMWSYRKLERPKVLLLLEKYKQNKAVYTFHNPEEAAEFLKKVMG